MRLSKEQKEKIYTPIIEEFLNDDIVTLQDLANKYDVSYTSLCAYARQKGVKTRKAKRAFRHDDVFVQKVVDEYVHDETASAKSLAKKYGICYPTVTRWLKRANVKLRYPVEKGRKEKLEKATELYVSTDMNICEAAKEVNIGKNKLREYIKSQSKLKKTFEIQCDISFNKDYFHELDTEEKAYWFGFIYADGCVRYDPDNNSGRMTIEIAEDDIDMLEKFNECLQSNVQIKKRQRVQESGYISKMCFVTLSSEKLCKDLMRYGCVPNKTYDGKIPKNLFADDKELMIAFLRGYLDGDGFVSDYRNSTSSMSYVIHNYRVMNFILKAIINVSGVIPSVRYEFDDKGGAYRLRITNRKDFLQFLDILYEHPSIYMERKYNRYLMHVTSRPEMSSQKSLDYESGIKLEGSQT